MIWIGIRIIWMKHNKLVNGVLVSQTTSKPATTSYHYKIGTTATHPVHIHGLNWEIDYVNFVRYRHVYWLFVFIFCYSSDVKYNRDIDEKKTKRERESKEAKKCTHGNHQFGLKRRGSTIATMRNGMQCKKKISVPVKCKQINQVIIMQGIGA